MAVIQTKGLCKEFRSGIGIRNVRALDRLDLEIREGEIFGFLGPNGAGKTTTLKLLMGFIWPTSGSARILGLEIGDVAVKQRIGFLPESPYFYDYLTAEEFLSFYGKLFGFGRSTIADKISTLLKQVSLEESRKLQLRKFSKGMLQRIGIAQALINDPQLVILDEPMSGLDPVGRKEVRDLILHLKEQGKTIFFSSHIIPDVEMLCDRVGILVKGRLHNIGHLGEILGTKLKYVEIVAGNLDGSAIEAFNRISSQVARTGNHLLIRIPSENDIALALDLIRNAKGRVVSIVPVKETLEEHFIREAKKESMS